ncbi:type III-B CRISPR module RAMP protein Cmr6, partial [Desulfosporosinus fructosivorans]
LTKYPPQAHAGLWYDKFFNMWEKTNGKWQLNSKKDNRNDNKKKWVEDAGKLKVGEAEGIESLVLRMLNLINYSAGNFQVYRNDSRFVTGLGRTHPVENGFTWHPTLGTPYLPGSSLKGMVRAWAEQWLGIGEEQRVRIFGSPTKKDESQTREEKQAGSVVFLDALPLEPVRLVAENMTPHYAPYYQEAKEQSEGKGTVSKAMPGDWYSATPIYYLAVKENQHFLFGLLPRPGVKGAGADLDSTMTWLKDALAWSGVGAKTATGYGRFSLAERDTEQLQSKWDQSLKSAEKERANKLQQEKRAAMTPMEQEMDDDGFDSQPERFMTELTNKWLPRMEDTGWPETEREMIAQRLAFWYQTNRPDQWKKPTGPKNVKKCRQSKSYCKIRDRKVCASTRAKFSRIAMIHERPLSMY